MYYISFSPKNTGGIYPQNARVSFKRLVLLIIFSNRKVEYLNDYLTISYNLQNLHRESVDSDKVRPLEMFGDAIAIITTNTTKPTGPSYLGGFVVSTENLSIH